MLVSSALYFHRKDFRVGIVLLEVEMDAINQLLLTCDADATRYSLRHLAEHGFHDIQPRAVLRRKDERETLRVKTKVRLRLF